MISAATLHKSYRVNEGMARNLAADILRMIHKEPFVDLEIVFTDDKAIKKFNKKYASSARATDVLSFAIDQREFGRKKFLGEIIISLDTALRNSKIYGADFAEEIVLYIIHGILHLFGYDDGNARDSRKMAGKQKRILDKLCACRNLSKVLMPR